MRMIVWASYIDALDRDDPNFVTNMSFLRGFIWNFDLFITPSKLMQIIIIFYRIRMNQSMRLPFLCELCS